MYVEDNLESAGLLAHLEDEAKALLMARRAHEYLIDALQLSFVVLRSALVLRLMTKTRAATASEIVFPIVRTHWPKVHGRASSLAYAHAMVSADYCLAT